MWRVLHIDVHACLLALFDVNVCVSIIDKYVVVALFQWMKNKSYAEREREVCCIFISFRLSRNAKTNHSIRFVLMIRVYAFIIIIGRLWVLAVASSRSDVSDINTMFDGAAHGKSATSNVEILCAISSLSVCTHRRRSSFSYSDMIWYIYQW